MVKHTTATLVGDSNNPVVLGAGTSKGRYTVKLSNGFSDLIFLHRTYDSEVPLIVDGYLLPNWFDVAGFDFDLKIWVTLVDEDSSSPYMTYGVTEVVCKHSDGFKSIQNIARIPIETLLKLALEECFVFAMWYPPDYNGDLLDYNLKKVKRSSPIKVTNWDGIAIPLYRKDAPNHEVKRIESLIAEAMGKQPRKRREMTSELLLEVANIYNTASANDCRSDVAAHFHVSGSGADKLIAKARERGFITELKRKPRKPKP